MHQRLEYLYDCNCGDCKSVKLRAGDYNQPSFKPVLKAGKKALKYLYGIGKYSPIDLGKEAYQELVSATQGVLSLAIADNVISGQMKAALENDAFLFGGLKAHAQLFEASQLLKNSDGTVKSWRTLEREFEKLNITYNQNYLEAEYQFAVSSAISADKWTRSSVEYDLQYRTAADERVRETHKAMHGITLPRESEFWQQWYPPNGWRCRCTAPEVLKGKYPNSDLSDAVEKGKVATTQIGADGSNKLAIFRFNPGAMQKLMPPANPYTKVAGAPKAKAVLENPDTAKFDKKVFAHFEVTEDRVKAAEFFNHAKLINEDIRPAEALGVYKYTGSEYGRLNDYLRAGRKPKNTKLDAVIAVTNSGLDKLEKYEGLAFRGTRLLVSQIEKYEAAFNDKSIFTELGYLSTSHDPTMAFDGYVSFKIRSKTGRLVKPLSQHPHEQEVLFKSNTQFKVANFVRNENGKVEISLDEI